MALTNEPPDLLPGTLDMLVLRIILRGATHGYGIAERLRLVSEDVLIVGESSLYPALQRLERSGCITSKWEVNERGKELKLYRLTTKGRKQLDLEESKWRTLARAIGRMLRPAKVSS